VIYYYEPVYKALESAGLTIIKSSDNYHLITHQNHVMVIRVYYDYHNNQIEGGFIYREAFDDLEKFLKKCFIDVILNKKPVYTK
jgi:hypothetical protein